jgi:hypothetical protein
MCVNLKELAVHFDESLEVEEPDPDNNPTNYMSPTHILSFHFYGFKLTKFVNDYFSQEDSDGSFTEFLEYQPNLESLELHSGRTRVFKSELPLRCLKLLGCPPQFLDASYSLTSLRLDFENSTDKSELDVLGRVLQRNLTRNMKSLAIFLKGNLTSRKSYALSLSAVYTFSILKSTNFSLLRYVHDKYQV